MSFRSSFTIVASPRPRVGKTLLARLLTDFHLNEGRLVTAFDLNVGERALAQFLPQKTTMASIRETSMVKWHFSTIWWRTRTPPK